MRLRLPALARALVVSCGLVVAAASCGDNVVSPAPLTRGGTTAHTETDPSPESAGYFLPDINPENCLRNYNPNVVNNDADWDWIADACEYALAQAFRPMMMMSEDACAGWEPHWAVKVFKYEWVRIAYMPAWYEDCGYSGHHGDSEMVWIEIGWNPGTRHWEVSKLWLSSHFRSVQDRSQGLSSGDMYYVDKFRGRPKIWVARDKHGNYKNTDHCNTYPDFCLTSGAMERPFPVHYERNVGSRHIDLLGGCVFAAGAQSGTGRCEGFYHDKPFNGWFNDPDVTVYWQFYPIGTRPAGTTSYRTMLMDMFEQRNVYGDIDWGPGPGYPMDPPLYPPQPPQNPTLTATVHGPTATGPGAFCNWWVGSNVPGTLSYEWRVDGNVVGNNQDLWYVFGSPGTYTLEASVSNGSTGTGNSITVTVSEWSGTCAVE